MSQIPIAWLMKIEAFEEPPLTTGFYDDRWYMMVYQLPFPLFLPKGLGFSLGFSTRHGLMMGCHPLAIAVDGPPEGRAGFFRGPRRREVRPHGDPSVDDAAGAVAAEVSRAKEGSISFLWTYGISMTFSHRIWNIKESM
jgi:hypothetical protein